eukprot:gene148-1671_t
MFSEDDEGEEANLSLVCALTSLTVITIIVSIASELLTGSIEEVSLHTGLGEAFLGMIVLPIAGNACEHVTAVMVAMKNKMAFSLNFDAFSALALTLAVIHSNFVMSDATSHWLLGVQLVAVARSLVLQSIS